MSEALHIQVGGNDAGHFLMDAAMANRHGLIAGATGTGKTITLQNLAESFSRIGVPVFLADVKGDLSGLAAPGRSHPKIDERVKLLGIDNYQFRAVPTVFWWETETDGYSSTDFVCVFHCSKEVPPTRPP